MGRRRGDHTEGVRNLREWLWTRWWWFAAALVVAAVVVVALWRVNTPQEAIKRPPLCSTSQLRARLGPTHRLAGGRVETSLLTLTNTATTCGTTYASRNETIANDSTISTIG